MAFDPLGERLTKAYSKSDLMVINVDPDMVHEVRRQYPFRDDRRPDLYKTFYE